MTFLPRELRLWHCLAALFIAVFSAYYSSLGNGRVMFDDEAINTATRPLASDKPLSSVLKRLEYNSETALDILTGRPLRDLSLQLDRLLFRDDPWGSHLINVTLHYFSSLAAFLAFSLLFGGRGRALAAALIFAVHPLQTESVAYLAGRRDILYGGFFLLSFYFGAGYLKERRRASLLLCLFFWALSLLSKQSAVALPFALLIYLPLLRGPSTAPGNRRLWLFLGSAAAFSVLYAVVSLVIVSRHVLVAPGSDWYSGGALGQYLTLPAILWKAVSLLVLPVNLCADYSYAAFPAVSSLSDPRFILPVLALAALAATAAFNYVRRPLITFSLLWLFVTYLPVLPLFPTTHNVEVFAEHWLYLPILGYAALLVSAAAELPGSRYPWKSLALGALLLLFGARTSFRNADWKDGTSLWGKTASQQPRCLRALNNYAVVKLSAGAEEEAAAYLQKALAVDPYDPAALINISNRHLWRGELEPAQAALRAAFKSPAAASSWRMLVFRLGVISFRRTNCREAMKNFEAVSRNIRTGVIDPNALTAYAEAASADGQDALAISRLEGLLSAFPDYAPALNALGVINLKLGRPKAALPFLEKAAADGTGGPEAMVNLSLAWSALKSSRKALRYAAAAAQRDTGFYRAWVAASAAHRMAGRPSRGEPFAVRAAAIAETPETLLELALVRRAMKKWDLALATFKRSRKLFPEDPVLHFHYAGTLWENGRDLSAYAELYALHRRHPDYTPAVNAMAFIRGDLKTEGLALPPP